MKIRCWKTIHNDSKYIVICLHVSSLSSLDNFSIEHTASCCWSWGGDPPCYKSSICSELRQKNGSMKSLTPEVLSLCFIWNSGSWQFEKICCYGPCQPPSAKCNAILHRVTLICRWFVELHSAIVFLSLSLRVSCVSTISNFYFHFHLTL